MAEEESALARLQEELRKAKEQAAEERAQRLEADRKAAEERAQREEADRKAAEDRAQREEADRKAAEERAQREEADRKAAEERAQREEADRKAAEDRKSLILERREKEKEKAEREKAERVAAENERRAQEEEFRRKDAEQALHNATKIRARDALLEPLPNYSSKTNLVDESSTKLKMGGPRPHRIEDWSDFSQLMSGLLDRVASSDLFVTKRIDVFRPESAVMDYEVMVHDFVGSILRHLVGILSEALAIADLDLDMGARLQADLEGGIPDIAVSFRARTVFVIEFKRPRVRFKADIPLRNGETGNRYNTAMQTYGYMITKGNLAYGFFTNYDQWYFLKRGTTDDGQQILRMSQVYGKSQARLALAAFIITVIETPAEGLTLGVIGAPGVADIGEDIPSPPPPADQGGASSSSSLTVGGEAAAGVRFTTTKDALGVTSLSLHARANSTRIHVSEKACTFRYRSGDLDLVWRQFDVYGLPRHSPDYSESILREMMCREIQTYQHLRDHWGTLVPRFIYCGRDFFVLWVFVTSYEGIDLRTLAKERGGLAQEVKDKARETLIQLHTLNVIHGDVALRNILFREKDAKVLWIDFEQSAIGGDNFTQRAEDELQQLEAELSSVPTEIVSGAAATKRTKVNCLSICAKPPCGTFS